MQNTPQGGLKGCQSVYSEPEFSITLFLDGGFIVEQCPKTTLGASLSPGRYWALACKEHCREQEWFAPALTAPNALCS